MCHSFYIKTFVYKLKVINLNKEIWNGCALANYHGHKDMDALDNMSVYFITKNVIRHTTDCYLNHLEQTVYLT